MKSEHILEDIRKINNSYDADYDIAPGPAVTYTDHAIVKICTDLLGLVAELQAEIKNLRQVVEHQELRIDCLADGTGIRTIQY